MQVRRKALHIAVTTVAASILGLVAASPAHAERTGCANAWGTGCSTNAIPQHGGWVYHEVWAGSSGLGCSWRVRDVTMNVVVNNGRVGAFALQQYGTPGLTNWYRLELYNCGIGAGGDMWS